MCFPFASDVIDSIKLTNIIVHGLTFVLVLHPIGTVYILIYQYTRR